MKTIRTIFIFKEGEHSTTKSFHTHRERCGGSNKSLTPVTRSKTDFVTKQLDRETKFYELK